jgi:hypothetical protein
MKGVTHLLIGACIGVQLVHDDPLLMQATGAICAAAALLPMHGGDACELRWAQGARLFSRPGSFGFR